MRSPTVAWRRSAGLALLLLLASASSSWALNPLTLISQYAADYWRTADGLPQASVGAIAQTADGYIWLATEEGLVRFDGVRFAIFDATNSALTDNYISSLRAGRGGVMAYAPTGGCRHHSLAASAFDADVTALVPGDHGTILIGTTRGLKQFD